MSEFCDWFDALPQAQFVAYVTLVLFATYVADKLLALKEEQ